MTSVFADTSALVDYQQIDASDVKTPIDQLDTALDNVLDAVQPFAVGALMARLNTDPAAPSAGSIVYDKSGTMYARNQAGTITTLSGGTVTVSANVDIDTIAGQALNERDAVYLSFADAKAYKLDADATASVKCSQVRGIVVTAGGAALGASVSVRLSGTVTGYAGLTAGGLVYADTTAGALTQTKPTVTAGGGQRVIVPLGIALTTTSIAVTAMPVTYVKRESLANNGTTLVEHHADAAQETRMPWALSYPTFTTSNTTGGTDYAIGNVGGSPVWGAQAFQLTSGGTISTMTATFRANTGAVSGTMTWQVVADNAGVPTGSVLGTGTFTPTASALNTITPGTSIVLAENTTYWLLFKPTTPQGSGVYWSLSYSAANPYAYNSAFSTNSGSSWTTSSLNDIIFAVNVVGNEETLVVGRWASGTRDMAVMFTDATGAASSTNTRFKNVSGATMDVVCCVRLA